MILPALIRHHLKHGDDAEFYRLQARSAIDWLKAENVPLKPGVRAIDLGCGHGVFGKELKREGCDVVFSDEQNFLLPELRDSEFRRFDIDRQELAELGRFDLVICSNVLEHLSRPDQFLLTLDRCLNPGGYFYLSWTNWLSPWGGHEFSPFHFLGPKLGPLMFDKLTGRTRKHTPGQNLHVTHIGRTLSILRRNPHIVVCASVPRYYTEFGLLTRLPLVREFLTWNCAMLIQHA